MHAILSNLLKRPSVPRDVLLTIVGAVIGLIVSHFYYLKSVSDMKADAEEQKRMNELILRGIENIGAVVYVRDGTGKVIGLRIQLRAAAEATASGSATLSVSKPQGRK